MNQTLSKVFATIRVPLAIAVLFSHYYTPDVHSKVLLGGVILPFINL